MLIGCSEYQDRECIQSAPADVKAIKNLLLTHWGYNDEDICVLIDRSKVDIQDEYQKLLNIAKNCHKNGIACFILFYYSGHGVVRNFLTTGLTGKGEPGFL